MKLITEPEIEEGKIYIKRLIKHHLFKPNEYVDDEYIGRVQISDILIESSELNLGEKVNYVEVDGYKLYGILPVEKVSENVFRCVIDLYEETY